jgi:hypothetical protein
VIALLKVFDLLPGWAWALICAGAMATAAVQGDRIKSLKLETAEAKAHFTEVARKAEAAHRQRERQHADDLAAINQRKADETRALALAVAQLTSELSKRPDRPAGGAVPTGTADPVGCTGAQLYRPDAAFLVGESARADQLRIALDGCQAAYDSAVRLTNN